jgi:trans-aconitate methyltransferase
VVSLGTDGTGLKPVLDRVRAESRESVRQQRRKKLADRFQYPLALACLLFGIALLPSVRGRE